MGSYGQGYGAGIMNGKRSVGCVRRMKKGQRHLRLLDSGDGMQLALIGGRFSTRKPVNEATTNIEPWKST